MCNYKLYLNPRIGARLFSVVKKALLVILLWSKRKERGSATHKVLLHKLKLVLLAVLAFLVREFVRIRGALARMEVAIALPVPPLPVPVASSPFGVASLVVVAVLGTPRSSMPAGCVLPT